MLVQPSSKFGPILIFLFCFQLYAPYSDNPSTSGAMRISAEVLESVIPRFLRDGWQVVSGFN